MLETVLIVLFVTVTQSFSSGTYIQDQFLKFHAYYWDVYIFVDK